MDFIRGHASHLHVIRQRDNAAGLIRTREERDPLSQGCVGNIRVGSRETRRDRERVESPKRTAEGERVVSNTEARPDDVLVAQTIGKADARSEVLLADRNVVIEIDVERVEIELLHGTVRPDDPVHELLRARVDPALLVDRAQHQLRRIGIEFRITAHAVDLGG